jgi:hypothetical protein
MMDTHAHQELILHRVVAFTLAGDYAIRVQFDDGSEQQIDFEPILYGSIFGPLRDPALFKDVQLDHDFGALVWPNGADIDPMVLYDWPAYIDGIVARRQVETLPE